MTFDNRQTQTAFISWALPLKFVFVMVLALAFAGSAFGQATLQITTTSLPGGVNGTAYPAQVLQASGGTPPYGSTASTCTPAAGSRWCVIQGSLPTGLTLSTDGIISGTPNAAPNTYSFVVQLTDSAVAPQQAVRSLSITVSDPLVITTTTLPNGTFGATYLQQSLQTTGGTLPNSWSIVAGALPQGLTLNSGGTISGTPTLSGHFAFTVRAQDNSNPVQSATKSLSISVLPAITTTSLPNGAVGVVYGPQQLQAGPGNTPYTWSIIAGALPGGLTLSSTGVVDGTPTTAATFNFTVGITDSSTPPLSNTKDLSIIVQPALTINTTTLPVGAVGSFYNQPLNSSGPTPVTWSVVSGTLPPGVSLNPNGALTGTPSVAGPFSFTVQAAGGNPSQTAQQLLSIMINPALSIQTQSLPPATIRAPYSTTLVAQGGISPYSWTALAPLPAGLTLNPTNGVLSGSPSSAGSPTVNVQVADGSNPPQTVSRSFTLTVSNVLTVVTSTLPDGEAGKPYTSVALAAAGGTPSYTWTLQSGGTFPAGMTLQADGTLSGTPATAGTYDFTVQVTDASTPVNTAAKPLTLKIHAPLDITTQSPLPVGVVGVPYSKQIDIVSGQTSLTWSSSGGLPPGITLSSTPTAGLLSGTPTQQGTFDFIVKADGANPVQTVQKLFRIVVNPALTIDTPPTLPDAFLGVDYVQAFVAKGGLGPYTWTNPGGNLTPGLTLTSGGQLGGIPQGVGTYQFFIQVEDSLLRTARVQFTLRVNNSLRITTDTLPNAFRNLPYSQQLLATGGTGALTWGVNSGTLPTGLSLNNVTGVLSGTPTTAETKPVTITVTDSRGLSAFKDFTITVDPPLPALSAPGLPSSILPAHATPVTLSLASPASSGPLSGKVVLTFTSKADVAGDDPMTRFSNGTRTVSFTIPANGTTAVFDPPVSLTAGSVAGTIRLAANFDNGGPQDVTVATTEIASTAPTITNVVAIRTGNGLEVQITGYSPSRRITSAEFTFDRTVNGKADRITVLASVGPAFNTWFTSPTSIQFGSAFSYLQSFDYTGGNVNDVQSVTVRLSNAQGSTASQVIPFK